MFQRFLGGISGGASGTSNAIRAPTSFQYAKSRRQDHPAAASL